MQWECSAVSHPWTNSLRSLIFEWCPWVSGMPWSPARLSPKSSHFLLALDYHTCWSLSQSGPAHLHRKRQWTSPVGPWTREEWALLVPRRVVHPLPMESESSLCRYRYMYKYVFVTCISSHFVTLHVWYFICVLLWVAESVYMYLYMAHACHLTLFIIFL